MGLARWKAKESVQLNKVLGTERLADGSERVMLRGVIVPKGGIVEGDLDPAFVKRYDDGEEYARSVVERLSDPADDLSDDDGELKGEELDRRGRELKIEGFSTMRADEKRAAVAEAEEEEQG